MTYYEEDKPYFMTNEEWYYFDPEESVYKLTNKAPQEAIESYNEFYEDVLEDEEIWSDCKIS